MTSDASNCLGSPLIASDCKPHQVALEAASRLAIESARRRLLAAIFGRWVRSCLVRPARARSRRGALETALLADELWGSEAYGESQGQLLEAAEMHLTAVREQRGWNQAEAPDCFPHQVLKP